MKERSLVVVTAGLGRPSSTRLLADRLSGAAQEELTALGVQARVETVELRDVAHDVVNAMFTGFPSGELKGVLDRVAAADGLIAVTPVFNASYSGLFKSFFDIVEDTVLVDKPVLIGATGGTARHSLALEHALRPMFAYLRAVVMPTAVFAATEDWAEEEGVLMRRVHRAARELAEQVERREPAHVEDPFELTTSFEQLLATED